MSATEYKSIAAASEAEFRDKGSRFYAFAHPVDDEATIKEKLTLLKEKYPDATHHCYAWILGPERDRFRANDDGEPGHSAGTPILRQIQSLQLSNVLVVVVRYYGGTNLGIPGLIKAYGTAARMALELSVTEVKKLSRKAMLRFEFGEEASAYRLLGALQADVLERRTGQGQELLFRYLAEREPDLLELKKKYIHLTIEPQ